MAPLDILGRPKAGPRQSAVIAGQELPVRSVAPAPAEYQNLGSCAEKLSGLVVERVALATRRRRSKRCDSRLAEGPRQSSRPIGPSFLDYHSPRLIKPPPSSVADTPTAHSY